MKILIYGAGVLGSYLAHTLLKAGHEVTLLARGRRLANLAASDLVIRHHIQRITTVDRPRLVEELTPEDQYDAVAAVMQKPQMEEILPILAANRRCGLFLLVGNNGEAEKTRERFLSLHGGNPTVLFGFLAAGGRREGERVICVHRGKTSLTVGSVPSGFDCKPVLAPIFSNTDIQLHYARDMGAWLKYHIAVVLPICCAIHWAEGNMVRLGLSQQMMQTGIRGIGEGIAVLEKLGIPNEPPTDDASLKKVPFKLRLLLRILCLLPMGKLMARDHAMSALDEMNELSREMKSLRLKANIPTPALDELELHFKSV